MLSDGAQRAGMSLGSYIRDCAIVQTLRDDLASGRLEILPPA